MSFEKSREKREKFLENGFFQTTQPVLFLRSLSALKTPALGLRTAQNRLNLPFLSSGKVAATLSTSWLFFQQSLQSMARDTRMSLSSLTESTLRSVGKEAVNDGCDAVVDARAESQRVATVAGLRPSHTHSCCCGTEGPGPGRHDTCSNSRRSSGH